MILTYVSNKFLIILGDATWKRPVYSSIRSEKNLLSTEALILLMMVC